MPKRRPLLDVVLPNMLCHDLHWGSWARLRIGFLSRSQRLLQLTLRVAHTGFSVQNRNLLCQVACQTIIVRWSALGP